MTNLITPQILVATESVGSALAFGVLLQLVALACAFGFAKLDYHNEKMLK